MDNVNDAHVLSLDEVKETKCAILEDEIYTHMLAFVYPNWYGVYGDTCHLKLYVDHKGCIDYKYSDYGKTWQLWSSKPTESQRKENPLTMEE